MEMMMELSKRDMEMLDPARNAGLVAVRQGSAWRFVGKRIDVMVARPAYLGDQDFQPIDPQHKRIAGRRMGSVQEGRE
jgi:hypothetical protein